jgi:hypothetical protein
MTRTAADINSEATGVAKSDCLGLDMTSFPLLPDARWGLIGLIVCEVAVNRYRPPLNTYGLQSTWTRQQPLATS